MRWPPVPLSRLGAAPLLLCCSAVLACDGPADAVGLPAQVLEAVNDLRGAQGRPRLVPDGRLQVIACKQVRGLAARGRLTHDGFDRRFDDSGRAHCVENLAAGFGQALPLLRAWRASPAHARNLVEPTVDRAGVASAGRYLVLLACSAEPAPQGDVETVITR